jgi:anaerobic ribonucleoside-triphosphate reductase activating protein
MKIIVNSIYENRSLVDGPGIRTVLFLQGCNLHCKGCQNRDTWDISKGVAYEVADLANELRAKTINKKLTISGGEPLMQVEALTELINSISDFDIALYTGHQREDVPQEIIDKIKYLKTGPFVLKLKSTVIPYVGSTNQKFEEVRK